MNNKLQLTLAILKPDVVKVPFVLKTIRERIISSGFHIIKSRELHFSIEDAKQFYSEHSGRFFYNRLITYMTSGPIHAYVLAHPVDAIHNWRKIMGPTKTFRAQFEDPSSIRGLLGLTDTRNSTHGSDSTESVMKEVQTFFPGFDLKNWYCKEEPFMQKIMKDMDEQTHAHK